MSKHYESVPQFSYDPSSDLLAVVDEQHAVCEPSPKHTHALFDITRSSQLQMSELTYTSAEQAILAATPVVESLNLAMLQDGLLNRPIEMSGPNIIYPKAELSLGSHQALITPGDVPDETDVAYQFDNGQVEGVFAGVWYGLRQLREGQDGAVIESEDGPYRVDLYYQVAIGGLRNLVHQGSLMASSLVSETTLEYFDDMRLRYIREALSVLLTTESPKVMQMVDKLNVTLSRPRHEAKSIRKIGSLVRDVYATGELRPEDTAALIDLIAVYINPQGVYDITVPHALSYSEVNGEREIELLVPATDDAPRYAQQASEIVFSEGYDCKMPKDPTVEPPQVTFNEKGVLEPFFVFETNEDGAHQVIHVPMRHIKIFRDMSS